MDDAQKLARILAKHLKKEGFDREVLIADLEAVATKGDCELSDDAHALKVTIASVAREVAGST